MKERLLTIRSDDRSIPCSFYEATRPRAVVLFGHGLSVDRFDETVLGPVARLIDHGFSVLVPELPLHGVRAERRLEWPEFVTKWQTYWATNGRDELLTEWQHILQETRQMTDLPIMYFGLSLGTQYGLLFLSQTTEVSAAVLGLFGSEPPPKSKVMNHCAPKVTMPVFFIQKLGDEIHPEENTRRLYETIGAVHKQLDATEGLHASVNMESIENACLFLRDQIPN